MSRPEKPINWELVESLLESGCSGAEIAGCCDMHPNTFYDRVQAKYGRGFTEVQTEKRAKGEANLRLSQYLKATGITKKGDNTLLIWLGKQRLNQKENLPETTGSDESNKQYLHIMQQLLDLQSSERNIADNNINSEAKS